MLQNPPQTSYDLIIIGGGIAGAGIARDAALRGARVLLLEKNTFGSGTSSRSSRLIHGGIRYLEIAWNSLKKGDFSGASTNLRFVFSALRECRTLERIAPDLVKPVRITIPVYRGDPLSPQMVHAGAFIYFLLAAFRGGGRKPRLLRGAEAALRALPPLRREGLLGAVQIWDRTTDDRGLTVKTIKSAVRASALCLENAEVLNWEKINDDFKVRVRSNGTETFFDARVLLNASGPWVDRLRGSSLPAAPLVSSVAGAHITVTPFLPESALLQAKDKRIFFCINTYDGCRIGTTERICDDPDAVQATDAEVDYLLEGVKYYFPNVNLSRTDILSQDAGIRPLARPEKSIGVHETSREHRIVRDPSGLVNVVGVKLTDHRRAAEDTLNFILPDLLKHNPAISKSCVTATTLL